MKTRSQRKNIFLIFSNQSSEASNTSMIKSRSLDDALEELKHIPQTDLYRLVVDGRLHQIENGWLEYAVREKNCLPKIFNALQFAFDNLMESNVSVNLIQKIHACVATGVDGYLGKYPGVFRDGTAFGLLPDTDKDGFVNKDGFFELLEKVNVEWKQYGAHFCIDITASNYNEIQRKELRSEYTFLINHATNAFDNKQKLWEDFSSRLIEISYYPPKAKYLYALLDLVIKNYNSAISQNELTSDERLELIAKFIKDIELIHLFPDGNGRTNVILLQRLLIQNGFPATMLFNPNNIDGYDITSLMKEIYKGMLITRLISHNPSQSVYNYKTISLKDLSVSDEKKEIITDYYVSEMKLYQAIQNIQLNHNVSPEF